MVERALRLGVLDLDALIHHDIAAIETWDQATSMADAWDLGRVRDDT
jgi:hypothetical protein